MTERTAETVISQIMWSSNSGYQFVHATVAAPWIKPRLCHDVPMPDHIDQAIKAYEAALEGETINAGDRTIVIEHKVDFLLGFNSHLGWKWIIIVGFYRKDTGLRVGGSRRDFDPNEAFHAKHQDHLKTLTNHVPLRLEHVPKHDHYPHVWGKNTLGSKKQTKAEREAERRELEQRVMKES